jgi:hypothetical protein
MIQINPNPPFFLAYMQPNGFLDASREAHGLWNYYLCARNAYETHISNALVFEGEKDPTVNFRQLFTSMAQMYGVQPNTMAKCWDMVDAQCVSIDLPKMPDKECYRFNRADIIRLN